MEIAHSGKEGQQAMPLGCSTFQQRKGVRLGDARVASRLRAICVALVAFTGFGPIRAFGEPSPTPAPASTPLSFSFTYDYASGTGSANPSRGITFSDFTLNNLSKLGTAFGVPVVGDFLGEPFSQNIYVAFTVFAPSGYEVSVDPFSLEAGHTTTAQAFFRVSAPGTSQEIRESYAIFFPPGGGPEPLFEARGSGVLTPTVVPEPSTLALGGFAAAGLVLMLFLRPLRGHS